MKDVNSITVQIMADLEMCSSELRFCSYVTNHGSLRAVLRRIIDDVEYLKETFIPRESDIAEMAQLRNSLINEKDRVGALNSQRDALAAALISTAMLTPEEVTMFTSGKKIDAVRSIKSRLPITLLEAKNFIEDRLRSQTALPVSEPIAQAAPAQSDD